eukprot:gene8808-6194_t
MSHPTEFAYQNHRRLVIVMSGEGGTAEKFYLLAIVFFFLLFLYVYLLSFIYYSNAYSSSRIRLECVLCHRRPSSFPFFFWFFQFLSKIFIIATLHNTHFHSTPFPPSFSVPLIQIGSLRFSELPYFPL